MCSAADLPGGGVRPGWSSTDGRERGGSDGVPEFCYAVRLGLTRRFCSSATCPASATCWTDCIAIGCPRSAISASRAAFSGLAATDHHHPARDKGDTLGRPAEITKDPLPGPSWHGRRPGSPEYLLAPQGT